MIARTIKITEVIRRTYEWIALVLFQAQNPTYSTRNLIVMLNRQKKFLDIAFGNLV